MNTILETKFDDTHQGDRAFLVWLHYSDLEELLDYLETNPIDWQRCAVAREIARRP